MPKWSPITLPNPINDEFKAASIDKMKPGSLNKNKDNRVSVEFQNNQAGKPKAAFEGCIESRLSPAAKSSKSVNSGRSFVPPVPELLWLALVFHFSNNTRTRTGDPDEQKVDVVFGVNARHRNDSDDGIADVDDSGDEADKGRNCCRSTESPDEGSVEGNTHFNFKC
ncbi:trinucleotide repeat-containing18 protein-like [Tripterygium wilfordii]|uniref:Trinucleotide repeat-containing18 protein-like n=1 Tax=Tripterygium wilfordii TaxID=458696 RepID=A0A7J7E008_TRIWF|nr:trinucleotide repeat-containing18 protein-like [Tripterygium wilfordii]